MSTFIGVQVMARLHVVLLRKQNVQAVYLRIRRFSGPVYGGQRGRGGGPFRVLSDWIRYSAFPLKWSPTNDRFSQNSVQFPHPLKWSLRKTPDTKGKLLRRRNHVLFWPRWSPTKMIARVWKKLKTTKMIDHSLKWSRGSGKNWNPPKWSIILVGKH